MKRRTTPEAQERIDLLNRGQMSTEQWGTRQAVIPIKLTAAVDPNNLPEGEIAWTSEAIMFVDTPTGDGRDFAGAGTTHRALPLPLMTQMGTPEMGGHAGAVIGGRIDSIDLSSFPRVPASGVFDTSDAGREAARLTAAGMMDGISVDLAVTKYELEFITEEVEEDGETFEVIVDAIFHGLEQEIMGATHTPFPAFAEARLAIADSEPAEDEEGDPDAEPAPEDEEAEPVAASGMLSVQEAARAAVNGALTAAAEPFAPPADWFHQPEPDELQPLTVTDDGMVTVHLAPWSTGAHGDEACHIGYAGVCVCAPSSETSYSRFHVGYVRCDDGTDVAVGSVTLRGGHAPTNASPEDAARHYDETDSTVVYLRIIDGKLGPWGSGCVRPGIDPDDLFALRGSSLSGDWREYPPGSGKLELLRVCCVNTPGFTVMRSSGEPLDLPDALAPLAVVAPSEDGPSVPALVAAAGTEHMARLKAERLRLAQPATVAEVEALTARMDSLAETNARLARSLARLEPDVRGRVLDSIGG